MNCFDCADNGSSSAAVGICHWCGAGVCMEHAKVHDHYLTRKEPIDQVIRIEPPARLIRRGARSAANEAVVHHDRHHGRHAR